MRRVAIAIVSTVAALVLLLSFKTHTTSLAAPAAAVAPAAVARSAAPSAAPSSATTKTSTAAAATTYTGDAADTRYGPVQVQITVTNGKVTAAQATEYPENDPRDQQINSYAIPALNQEAVQAGSASIDMVSGATFTSQGYLESLQSALDKAGN